MSTNVALVDEKLQIKRYKIQHSVSDYTFPVEASIHQVEFDESFLTIELSDGRRLSIPLWWIPTVYHADPQERQKYEISRNRKMIIWDPDKCAINDEVRIADYLGPVTEPSL